MLDDSESQNADDESENHEPVRYVLVLVNRSRAHIRSISRHKHNAKSFIVDEAEEEEGEVSDEDVTGSEHANSDEEESESTKGSESGDASESDASDASDVSDPFVDNAKSRYVIFASHVHCQMLSG